MKYRGRIVRSKSKKYLITTNRYFQLIIQKDFDFNNFDIVEAEAYRKENTLYVKDLSVLTEGKKPDGRENWKRMIYDPELKTQFRKIHEYIQKIREFFLKKNFIEVYTPVLTKYPAMEPNIDSFETWFGNKQKMYLHTSPEYFMKKLLAAGFHEKIFEISPVFRNNEFGKMHNPEFLMLEWYRMYKPYENLIKDLIDLTRYLASNSKIEYDNKIIDLTDVEKITLKQAFNKYADKDLEELRETKNWKDKFFEILVNDIEPNLGGDHPTILYEYPKELAALAKLKNSDRTVAKRFELYIGGIELANCFEELTDPAVQLKRFKKQKKKRRKNDLKDYPIDETFINALKIGMPPSSGGALGINRLIMILLDKKDIKETLLFPYQEL